MWQNAVVLVLVLCVVDCYDDGAGDTACNGLSMVPGHSGSAQTATSPYSIYLSDIQYSPSSKISVTLQGTQSFLGFLVVAVKEADNTQYGSLSAAGATSSSSVQQKCGTGLTHTKAFSSNGASKVELQWQAPVNGTGNIVFYATFVKKYDTYWVKVSSSGVWDGKGNTPRIWYNSTAPASSAHKLQSYTGSLAILTVSMAFLGC